MKTHIWTHDAYIHDCFRNWKKTSEVLRSTQSELRLVLIVCRVSVDLPTFTVCPHIYTWNYTIYQYGVQ